MNAFLLSKQVLKKNFLLLICSIHYSITPANNSSLDRNAVRSETPALNPGTDLNLAERFQLFTPVNMNAEYRITICADVPDNGNPERVHVGQQPGHVFLILEKTEPVRSGQSTVQVFGFYPVRQHSSLIAGNVRAKIMDNSKREYNAAVSKKVSYRQFQLLLQKAEQLSGREYNLHRFNCYDYVLDIFNSISDIEKLPVTHVKLPYFLGRAGSPCGLYRDLKRLQQNDPQWTPYIQLGIFTAPESTRY